MKALGLANFDDIYLTNLGLVIFFAFFVGVIVWVYRQCSQDVYSYSSEIPFDEEDVNE